MRTHLKQWLGLLAINELSFYCDSPQIVKGANVQTRPLVATSKCEITAGRKTSTLNASCNVVDSISRVSPNKLALVVCFRVFFRKFVDACGQCRGRERAQLVADHIINSALSIQLEFRSAAVNSRQGILYIELQRLIAIGATSTKQNI